MEIMPVAKVRGDKKFLDDKIKDFFKNYSIRSEGQVFAERNPWMVMIYPEKGGRIQGIEKVHHAKGGQLLRQDSQELTIRLNNVSYHLSYSNNQEKK